MKKFIIIVLAFIGLYLMCGIAAAEPTIEGPSGLLVSPTADVATPESAWIGGNYIQWKGNDIDSTIWTYTITGGISENFELGAMGTFAQDADDGFGVNAKYLLMKEDPKMPGVACGIVYTDVGNTVTRLYLVGSKYYTADNNSTQKAMSFHGGVGYLNGDNIDNEWTFWGGADFNLSDKFIGIVEYIDADEGYNGFTYGVRYYGAENWTAQAGMIDGNFMLGASVIF